MNVDDYVSASEAARILGVSRQRVATMIREGDLPAVYPWPRAVRINRSAVEAWMRGERPIPVHRTAARAFVINEGDVDSIDRLDEVQVRALCRRFITERRPEWTTDEARTWAEQMAPVLMARDPRSTR